MSKRVEQMKSEVPLWLVASLGRRVALERDYRDDDGRIYPAGYEGILMAVRGADLPAVTVDVCLNMDDPDDWERLMHWDIRPPAKQIIFELDIDRGVIAF